MAEYNGYVGAPYNFIGINKNVNRVDKEKLQVHNVIDTALKSGKIEYEIEAVTPIFVSAGKKEKSRVEEFYKNCYGDEVIPGSTVRGLVRSNVQILSSSSVIDDIQNRSLMYRDVAGNKKNNSRKKTYDTLLGSGFLEINGKGDEKIRISVLKNVRAGYICNKEGSYTIIPTVVDTVDKDRGKMNYYVVSERKIIEDEFRGFEFLKQIELQHEDAPFNSEMRGGSLRYKGTKNEKYRPYISKIGYYLRGSYQITGITAPGVGGEAGLRNGYLLSSGPMIEKKAVYIIPEMDEGGEIIKIPREDIDSYKRDYEGKKNQIETIDKKFFRLPEDGEIKPVFYIDTRDGRDEEEEKDNGNKDVGNKEKGDKKGRIYFGFTPRLRLFYDKDIYEGIPEEQKEEGIDYSQSLFGYVREKESYKSRLSFMDAKLNAESGKVLGEVSLILSGPKPTSYLDYLKGMNDCPVTYNDMFELRGIKQYWLKEKTERCETGKNQGVVTSFKPYSVGTTFKGEIRFHNLTEEELGMVLWGLILEENSQQNIGKGKPYGYGRVKIHLTGLKVLNQEALYNSYDFCMDPYVPKMDKKDYYINLAKEGVIKFLGKGILDEKRLEEFFLMKAVDKIPDRKRTQYMKLSDYQGRVSNKIPLPEVGEVVRGDTERHYKQKRDDSQKTCEKNNKGKNHGKNHGKNRKKSENSIGTSFGELLKGIKLE
ncbi:TIGR03986 family CRISPR-associated RAMP protein [Lachnospiraceae bacterium 62-26]